MLFENLDITWKTFADYLNEDVDSSPHQFEFFVKKREAYVVHFFNGEKKAYSISEFYNKSLKVSSDNVLNSHNNKNMKEIEEVNGSFFIKLLLNKLSRMPETRYAYEVINNFKSDEVDVMRCLVALFFPETKAPVDFAIGRTLAQASIRMSLELKGKKPLTAQNYTAAEIIELVKEKIDA